jgi:ATP-binding cassette subfamily C protein
MGVLLIGFLGSLIITGITYNQPGNRTQNVLEILGIDSLGFQSQVFIIGLVATLLLSLKTFLSLYMGRKVLFFLASRGAQLSSHLMSALFAKKFLYISKRTQQETIYCLTTGVTTITFGILSTVSFLIADISLLVIMWAGLFVVDFQIAVATLMIFSVVAGILYLIMHKKVKKLGIEQANLNIKGSQLIGETLNSYRELYLSGLLGTNISRFRDSRVDLANVMAENTFLQNASKYSVELTVVLGTMALAGLQFATQSVSHAVATLSIFLAASTRIAPGVLRIQQGFLTLKSSSGTAFPTLQLLHELGTSKEIQANHLLADGEKEFIPKVRIKNLTFSYPDAKKPTITDLSMEIKSSEVVAFVGPSGGGKSTLVDLILGIHEVEEGEVLVSGLKPEIAVKRWPGKIGFVPQEVKLSNTSLDANVALGVKRELIEVSNVQSALKSAHLESLLKELPGGLNQLMGDKGRRLSGGQLQRLGIARAFYLNPRILILDEATSSLDAETENSISQTIEELKREVTLIIIAHRLSTVRKADCVHYIDGGRLIASGTFEEVRAKVPDFDKQAKLMGL